MPLIRVVIPTFALASLLDEALYSVAAQSITDYEVIVADDGSTDATSSVLLKWQEHDRRFRSVYVNHRGAAAARNAALPHPGDYTYVAFLDSDDLWTENHLAECIDLLEGHQEVAITFAVFQTIDRSGTWTSAMLSDREVRIRRPARLLGATALASGHLLDTQAVHHALLRGEFSPHPSTAVVRAAAIASLPWFDEGLEILEDCLFFLRIASSDSYSRSSRLSMPRCGITETT